MVGVWVGFGELCFGTWGQELFDCLVGLNLCRVFLGGVLIYVVYPQVYEQLTPL